MATVTVFNVKKQEMEKLQRELWWYHKGSGELLKFIGGRLDLVTKEFDEKLGIYRPKIVDVLIPTAKTSSKEVMDWINLYTNYNVSDASVLDTVSDGTVIDVPDKELSDVLYDLERHNLRFRVE